MTGFTAELAQAVHAAREAAQLCESVRADLELGSRSQQPGVRIKADRSPVTLADLGAQALVAARLSEAFPADPLIAEEDADHLRSPAGAALLEQVAARVRAQRAAADAAQVCDWIDRGRAREGGARAWTLDPVDGTKGFLRGEGYAVGLALLCDGRPAVAAVACPWLWQLGADPEAPRGILFSAVRGQGAWSEPLALGRDRPDPAARRRLQVSEHPDLSGARACESVEPGHHDREWAARVAEALSLAAAPLRMDGMGKYGLVARGEVELYLRFPRPGYRENVWDHAAGALVCEEAGGRVTDLEGRPLRLGQDGKLAHAGGIVASHGRGHDALLDVIRRTAPKA